MTLRQQLVSDRVANLVVAIGIPQDQAFERFVHSLVTGQSVHSLDPADWVDGNQDKQIDLISIEEEDDEADIFIISAKFTDGFSSNAIILMRNGLGWMLNRPRTEVATISNEAFRDKILEVRSVLSGIGPANVRVRCYFATNGLTSTLSAEYQQEVRGILAEYDNGTFAEFSFETLGADELVGLINRIERRNRSIDADVPIATTQIHLRLFATRPKGSKESSVPQRLVTSQTLLSAIRAVRCSTRTSADSWGRDGQ